MHVITCSVYSPARPRDHPVRAELREGREDEAPDGEPRVRHDQARLAQHHVTVEQDVQVERPGRPAHGGPDPAARLLDPLEDVEEVDVEKLKEMVHVKDEDIQALDKLVVQEEARK